MTILVMFIKNDKNIPQLDHEIGVTLCWIIFHFWFDKTVLTSFYSACTKDMVAKFFFPEITKSHWISSETCPTCCNKQCRRKFSLLDRPHHCRRYKDVFVKHLIIVSILRAISKVSTFWHFHTWIHVKVHVTNVRQ